MRRGRFAWTAIAAGMAGCTLVTGVGDLDPSLGPPGIDPSDATVDSDIVANAGDASNDASGADVSQPETSTRIKDITFENGAIIHPQTGVDRALGDAGLALLTKDANVDESGDATTAIAIGGDFSLQVSAPALVEETFGPLDEVYFTLRVRIDEPVTSTVSVMRVTPEGNANVIELRLLSTLRLAVFLGTQVGPNSSPLTIGKVHRIGVHVRKGKNANGRLEVSLADDGAPFGTPFAQSTTIDFERPEILRLGLASAASIITFDDVKIDGSELPPP